MANVNSLTIGNTSLPVANSLAALDDTNIPATPAEGSVLTMQSGKWAPNTVEGAIGGTPVTTSLNSATVLYSNGRYNVLQSIDSSGTKRQVVFDEVGKCVIIQKMDSGETSWTRFALIQNALETALTGLDATKYGNIGASDNVLTAIGKLSRSDYSATISHSNNGSASSGIITISNICSSVWAVRYSGQFRGIATAGVKEKIADIPSGFPTITLSSMFITISGGMYQLAVENRSTAAAAEKGIFASSTRAELNKPDWSFGIPFLCA